jgi:hypothetical protein
MSRNACYHLVQDLMSSSLLSKNTKIMIYRSIIFPGFSFVCVCNLVAHIEEGK